MKKQLFIALLASALMITSVPMAVFAQTTDKTTTSTATQAAATGSAITTSGSAVTTTNSAVTTSNSAITDEDVTGPAIDTEAKAPDVLSAITLTLDGAYKKLAADSPQVIIAKYELDNELTVGKGYSENLSDLSKSNTSDSFFVDTTNKATLQACKKFANEQAPKNYEAKLNELKNQTYEMYYNYKYTEEQVQVAKDNLTRTKSLYDSTMLQFKVGKVSKLDTLKAETDLNDAKDKYQLAVNGLAQIKMNFNLFMGYNIHQPVKLTDSLTALEFPKKTVEAAVKEALATRNEILEVQYQAEVSQLSFNSLKAYPASSAKYKKAKVSMDMAQEGLKSVPGQVEIDVRTKYMDMKQKYDAVQSGKIAFENSKESSRLGQLQFDNGFITVNDLSGINLNTFNSQQAYYKAILDYNLAVNAYNLASGVGVKTASIQ